MSVLFGRQVSMRSAWIVSFSLPALLGALPVSAQSLPPVYVTAPSPYAKVQEAPVSMVLIKGEDIAQSPYTTLTEVLRNLGGVMIRPSLNGSRDGTIDLDGFGEGASNNVVVVVDGIRLNENEQSSPRFSNIPLATIQTIEIIRGGSSVEYGDGASGGVVRITTRKRIDEGQHAFDVTAAYGSFNTQELNLAFRKQLGSVALGLTGAKTTTNGYRDNSSASYDQAGVTLDWAQADWRAGVSASSEGQNNRFPGALTQAQAWANPQTTTHPNDYGVFNRNLYTAYVAMRQGENEYGVRLNRREQIARGFFSGFESTRRVLQDQVSPYVSLQINDLAGQHNLRFGLEQQHWRVQESTWDSLPTKQESLALFVSDDWKLNDRWRLNWGSRVEHSDQQRGTNMYTYSLLANELGASWAWQPNTVLFTRLSRSYRLPNVDDNSYATSTFLAPQVAREVEAGVRHTYGQNTLSARAFVMNLDNEIVYDPTVGLFGSNTNLDKTRRRGIGLSWNGTLAKDTLGNLSYQYVDAEFRAGSRAGGATPLVPAHRLMASMNHFWTENFSTEAVWQVQSSQRPGGDISQKYASSAIPGFGVLDLNLGWKVNDLQWGFQVQNVFDRQYWSYAFGNTGVYPQPGRAYKVTLKTSF